MKKMNELQSSRNHQISTNINYFPKEWLDAREYWIERSKCKKTNEYNNITIKNKNETKNINNQINAKIHTLPKKLSDAKEYWIQRSRFNETNGRNFYHIAPFYQISGNTFLEIRHYQHALRYELYNPDIHNDYGLALLRQNEYDKAKDHFEKAIQINSNHTLAMINLSALHAKLGNYNEARSLCEKVIQIDSNNAMAHRNLAKILEMDFCDLKGSFMHNKIAIQLENKKSRIIHQNKMINAQTHRIIARQLVSLKQNDGDNDQDCPHKHIDEYRSIMNKKYDNPYRYKTDELVKKLSGLG